MKEMLKYTNNLLNDKLKYIESKFSILVTLPTALTVFSATYLNNFPPLITALSSIAIIFSLISVLYGFLAIFSRRYKTKNYEKLDKKINIFYYKDISKINEKNYIEEIIKNYPDLKGYKSDNFDLDLSKQIVNTSQEICQKNIFFNFSIIFLLISLLTESLAIFLLGLEINI